MQQLPYRTGLGIDFHQLVEGRELWIGGIHLQHHKGALGHSDADVLLHAICDAMLGAVSLGDIGVHFPDTDDSFKDIDSKILLEKSYSLVKETGYQIGNIDATVCLEFPKLKPYTLQMRKTIAQILNISLDAISIKATTSEKMGFVGREEGISAFATILLMRNDNNETIDSID